MTTENEILERWNKYSTDCTGDEYDRLIHQVSEVLVKSGFSPDEQGLAMTNIVSALAKETADMETEEQ